ncbi:MAG: hypothetical protein WCD66_13640 [Rhodanobacteraceae bacterium]
MNAKKLVLSIALTGLCASAAAVAGEGQVSNNETNSHFGAIGIVKTVLDNASKYQSIHAATEDGYVPITGCIAGEAGGAMGVHYARLDLFGDGVVDPATPEMLVYEPTRWGSMRLVAADYLVFKAAWEGQNGEGVPPIVQGQHFMLAGEPNRYAAPAFYLLHVWAFKHNRNGMFAMYNPDESCEYYDPDA